MNCLKLVNSVFLLMFLQRSESENKTIFQSDKRNHLIICPSPKYIKIREAFYGSIEDLNKGTPSWRNSCENKQVLAAVNEKCNCTTYRNETAQLHCIINMKEFENQHYGEDPCSKFTKYLQIIYDCVDQIECGIETTTPRNLSDMNFTSSTTIAFANNSTSNSWLVLVVVVLLILVLCAMIGLYWIACRKKLSIRQCLSKTKATRNMTNSLSNEMQESANESARNIQSQSATYEVITENKKLMVENQLYASPRAAVQKKFTENTNYDELNSSRIYVTNKNDSSSKSQYSKLNVVTKENKTDVNCKQVESNELYNFEETGEEHNDPSFLYNEILEPHDHENTAGSHYQTVHNELYGLN